MIPGTEFSFLVVKVNELGSEFDERYPQTDWKLSDRRWVRHPISKAISSTFSPGSKSEPKKHRVPENCAGNPRS